MHLSSPFPFSLSLIPLPLSAFAPSPLFAFFFCSSLSFLYSPVSVCLSFTRVVFLCVCVFLSLSPWLQVPFLILFANITKYNCTVDFLTAVMKHLAECSWREERCVCFCSPSCLAKHGTRSMKMFVLPGQIKKQREVNSGTYLAFYLLFGLTSQLRGWCHPQSDISLQIILTGNAKACASLIPWARGCLT